MPDRVNRLSEEPTKVIKFDMKTDDSIRSIARLGYEIAKKLKDSGLKFKKVIPAVTDMSVRKLFKLPPDSELLCLEIDISKKTEEDKIIIIGEIKDQFLSMDNIQLIDEKSYKLDNLNNVYRFLFKNISRSKPIAINISKDTGVDDK
jgi:hypothetical protein